MRAGPQLPSRRLRVLAGWLAVGTVLATGGCRQVVNAPADQVPGDADLGRIAMEEYGCAACHVIPGVAGADNLVGPPLERFAERRVIAGRLPNNPANLAAWLENPQEVDPGNAMPNLGVSPEEAENMAAYLYTLR